jgi:hypothetical protein
MITSDILEETPAQATAARQAGGYVTRQAGGYVTR